MDLSSVQDQIHEQAKGQLGISAPPWRFRGASTWSSVDRKRKFASPRKSVATSLWWAPTCHGLALLLGSTALCLHGARRDVLAVRVGEVEDKCPLLCHGRPWLALLLGGLLGAGALATELDGPPGPQS